jgi:F0F1-type ATP synthase assembly protein I
MRAAKSDNLSKALGRVAHGAHSIPRAAMSAHTQSEVHSVKAIIIALIVVGIAGLILSAVLPVVGIPGIIGSVAALLAGIGFLVYSCFCCRS